MPDKTEKAKEVKQRYEDSWLSIKGVTAVGIGLTDNRDVGIIISVSENSENFRKQIPAQVEGIPIEVQETGEFKAQ